MGVVTIIYIIIISFFATVIFCVYLFRGFRQQPILQ